MYPFARNPSKNLIKVSAVQFSYLSQILETRSLVILDAGSLGSPCGNPILGSSLISVISLSTSLSSSSQPVKLGEIGIVLGRALVGTLGILESCRFISSFALRSISL